MLFRSAAPVVELTRNPDAALNHLGPDLMTATAAEIENFNGLDAAKAIIIATKAKLDRSVSRAFLVQLRFYFLI
mgnify:CR=1 FL=1